MWRISGGGCGADGVLFISGSGPDNGTAAAQWVCGGLPWASGKPLGQAPEGTAQGGGVSQPEGAEPAASSGPTAFTRKRPGLPVRGARCVRCTGSMQPLPRLLGVVAQTDSDRGRGWGQQNGDEWLHNRQLSAVARVQGQPAVTGQQDGCVGRGSAAGWHRTGQEAWPGAFLLHRHVALDLANATSLGLTLSTKAGGWGVRLL